MTDIRVFAILILSAALACGGSYVKGRGDGKRLAAADRAEAEEIARVSRNVALAVAAESIAGITVKHTTIRQKAEVEIREKPVYRDCITTPDVIGLLDAARAGQSAPESAGNSGVPEPRASKP